MWGRYRYKNGPLSPVRKYDVGSAIIAAQINNAHGGKAKPLDFLPYGSNKETNEEVSAEDFVNALTRTGRAKMGR